ncbi:MAG: pseudouridine-5'-phosphate glycosidase [Candidatus Cryosericum sp.]
MARRAQRIEHEQLTEHKTNSRITKGFAEGVKRGEPHTEEFIVSEEVQEALRKGIPVVALESAIITHGMPYPVNLELAQQLEEIVRKGGAVPATTAVVSGKVRVGLSKSELEMLARAKWVKKIGPRDIPVAVVMGFSGGTTVAASLHIADAAGINVFVTGGIGGVHRGVSEVLDISQDLPVIGRAHCITVCAGAKSILDLRNTLEYLETMSVLVLGYQTDTLPAFYVRDSGIPLEHRVESASEIAAIVQARDRLKLTTGILVTNPIAEADQVDPKKHEKVLQAALKSAAEDGIEGKAMTPFILAYMQKNLSGVIEANIALIKSNVALGTQIAVALKHS